MMGNSKMIDDLLEAINHHAEPDWLHAGLDERDDDEALDARREWGRRLSGRGLIAPTLPESVGGMGLGHRAELAYWVTLLQEGAPVPLNGNVLSVLAPALIRFGTEEQVERFLPPMIAHEVTWCQAFSEPEAGSDLKAVSCRAIQQGDAYVLHGEKTWSSFGHYCDWAYVLARTEPGSRGAEGLSLLLVPLKQEGVQARGIRTLNGKAIFSEIHFDGAMTSADNIVASPGDGWRIAMFALSQERALRIALRSLGLRQELRTVARLASQRESVGDVRQSLVRAWGAAFAIEALFDAAVQATESPHDEGIEGSAAGLGSMAKLLWLEARGDLLRDASRLAWLDEDIGEPGTPDALLDSLLISRADSIRGGTTEIHLNGVARTLGLPSSR